VPRTKTCRPQAVTANAFRSIACNPAQGNGPQSRIASPILVTCESCRTETSRSVRDIRSGRVQALADPARSFLHPRRRVAPNGERHVPWGCPPSADATSTRTSELLRISLFPPAQHTDASSTRDRRPDRPDHVRTLVSFNSPGMGGFVHRGFESLPLRFNRLVAGEPTAVIALSRSTLSDRAGAVGDRAAQ
jgi:hypothetical protein